MRLFGLARAIMSGAALVIGLALATVRADAAIVVRVDKSTQTMRVIVDGEQRHVWHVSTGRIGYNTPVGTYRPQRLERDWRSRKYNMAPMPHAIFFRGGYAIHGTNMVRRLGRTDSHGCIRLAPGNARTLFNMVAAQRGATRIVIEGTAQPDPVLVANRRGNSRVAARTARPRTEQMSLAQPGRAETRAALAEPARVDSARPAAQRRVAPSEPLQLTGASARQQRIIRASAHQPRIVRTDAYQQRASHTGVRQRHGDAGDRQLRGTERRQAQLETRQPRQAYPAASRAAAPRPQAVQPQQQANPFANWFLFR
ncbi:hypothetical protein BN1110_06503 [bacterium YEK0313]|nr:hypothetical protein BN1110_06503 [bacterium YEK0313]